MTKVCFTDWNLIKFFNFYYVIPPADHIDVVALCVSKNWWKNFNFSPYPVDMRQTNKIVTSFDSELGPWPNNAFKFEFQLKVSGDFP